MLNPENPELRPLRAADVIWVAEMGFLEMTEAALVLRGLPDRSSQPAADLETLLETPYSEILPYYALLRDQQQERGDSETNPATGFFVYMPAHAVDDIDCIRMRPPKVRDMMGVDPTAGAAGDVVVISRLTGIPMETIKRLHIGDFIALQDGLFAFLRADPSTTSMETTTGG